MKITDHLESIMSKVSDGFPAFKEYLAAKKLIRQYFRALPPHSQVLLLGSQQTDIDYTEYLIDDAQDYKSIIINTNNDETINFSTVSSSDKVVIVSYYDRLELHHALDLQGIGSECLYDYFSLNGLVLQHNWYDYIISKYQNFPTYAASYDFRQCTGYRELYYERKLYTSVGDNTLKAFHLRRMIFICLHMRDFIYAKRYIDEYVTNKYANAASLTAVWIEIEALLEGIKTTLSHRAGQDTLMFWLDSLEYGDDVNMPFLNGLKDHTLVFKNAFTVTPYTNFTLRAILTGKKVIDDKSYLIKKISKENSPFIRVLEANGVDFAYCGHLSNYIDKPYHLRVPLFALTPTGNVFWSATEKLLSCDNPVCLMIHELVNSHHPFISSANDANKLFAPEYFQYSSRIDWSAVDRQWQESLTYLDEQLAFYNALLPESLTKIYFSDHGNTINNRYHAYLKINGCKIQSKTIYDIFSYLDWDKLIGWLYNPKTQPLSSIAREYAEIQDIDYYNGEGIKQELKGENHLGVTRFLSYRGVVTRDELYILRSDGFERFYNRDANRPPISSIRLDELRQLSGNYFIDPFSDPKFKYSRYVYKAIDNYLKRTGSYEQDKTAALRKLFTTDKTVAIRTGAEAAFQVLWRLAPDLLKNVKYIIDRNPNCIAGNFSGIAVINPEKACHLDIDMIVMPTFQWKGLLETECYGKAQIIHLTDYLAGLGFSQNKEFWEYAITDEDIDFEMED